MGAHTEIDSTYDLPSYGGKSSITLQGLEQVLNKAIENFAARLNNSNFAGAAPTSISQSLQNTPTSGGTFSGAITNTFGRMGIGNNPDMIAAASESIRRRVQTAKDVNTMNFNSSYLGAMQKFVNQHNGDDLQTNLEALDYMSSKGTAKLGKGGFVGGEKGNVEGLNQELKDAVTMVKAAKEVLKMQGSTQEILEELDKTYKDKVGKANFAKKVNFIKANFKPEQYGAAASYNLSDNYMDMYNRANTASSKRNLGVSEDEVAAYARDYDEFNKEHNGAIIMNYAGEDGHLSNEERQTAYKDYVKNQANKSLKSQLKNISEYNFVGKQQSQILKLKKEGIGAILDDKGNLKSDWKKNLETLGIDTSQIEKLSDVQNIFSQKDVKEISGTLEENAPQKLSKDEERFRNANIASNDSLIKWNKDKSNKELQAFKASLSEEEKTTFDAQMEDGIMDLDSDIGKKYADYLQKEGHVDKEGKSNAFENVATASRGQSLNITLQTESGDITLRGTAEVGS